MKNGVKCLFLCLEEEKKSPASRWLTLALFSHCNHHIWATIALITSVTLHSSYFISEGRKTPAKITTHYATRGRSLLCICPNKKRKKKKQLSAAATVATWPSQFARQRQDIYSVVHRKIMTSCMLHCEPIVEEQRMTASLCLHLTDIGKIRFSALIRLFDNIQTGSTAAVYCYWLGLFSSRSVQAPSRFTQIWKLCSNIVYLHLLRRKCEGHVARG